MRPLHGEACDVIIDGKRLETLHYCSARPDSTIVMLHEGLGSVSMWRDFPEQVAELTGCSVLLYSRYGHGKSQRLTEQHTVNFMHHEAKIVLPELFAHFKIDRPILLGHSDGGSIALIYAGTGPARVHALALEAPHVFVEDVCLTSIEKLSEAYKTTDLPLRFRRYHDHPDEMFWAWTRIWLDPEFRSWNLENLLPAITCPVQVIQGENDEYGTLAQVCAIKSRIPNAETVILPDCGHSAHRDQPAATVDAIVQFLARSLPRG